VLLNTVAMLEDLGHQVFDAISGPEALQLLERHEVDLVITDYAMPGMTGLQLAEAVGARKPGLPVLLATGYAELPAGADIALPQLAKPFDLDDLARALAKVVRPA
jgi:CheY-like chemotaxis protein